MKNPFSRAFWGAVVAISLAALALFYCLFKIGPEDENAYQELLGTVYGKDSEINYSTTQKRKLPSKTLLLSQDQTRKLGFLKSNSSELFFNRHITSAELVEELHDVELIFQETITSAENPAQVILTMRADQAKYFYKQEKLIAENVELKRYWIIGKEFNQDMSLTNPFFEGSAGEFILALAENQPKLEVFRLKAKFQKGP